MKLLILCLVFSSCKNERNSESTKLENVKYESSGVNSLNIDTIELNNFKDVANGVVDFLINKDTSEYLNLAIPLEDQKYLARQNFVFRPDIKDTLGYIKELESNFDVRMDNFLVRSGYIQEIMIEDKGFEIKKAVIDTVYYDSVRIKNYGGFNNQIVGDWADATVKFKYKGKSYYFEIPQIIKVRNKWYLYYPEYYLRDQRELEFVEKRVKEINEKAKDFWK